MATITRTIEIDRPIEEVWRLFEDVRRLPEFSPSTTAVFDAPPALTEPGQKFRQVVRKVGRCFESEWQVLAVERGHSLTIEGSVGFGVKYRITEQVTALGPERTRACLHIDYKLPFGPLGRLARGLGVDKLAESESGQVLQGLKTLLESPAERPTPAR